MISDRRPEPRGAGPFRGTLWPHCVLPLTDGMSLEQQVLLPAAGDAIAISWRLIGRPSLPVRLRLSPLFLADEPFAAAGFRIEPENSGGRLAWAPRNGSSKIFTDTNGRFINEIIPSSFQFGVLPASSVFALGPRPAILIFSAEIQSGAGADPLIGAFLAQLAEQRTAPANYDQLRALIAA